MIIVGNQRGGAADLAQHLMKSENERVQVHELRGFLADDLHGAFRESYALSRATRCKQHLFSCSFNPPKDQSLDVAGFERAIDQAEERLGLTGQPRAIVFHEKRGDDGELRRHAHAVWCRITPDAGKSVHLPHYKTKLNDLSRDLFREYGWRLPRGYERHEARDPATYSLAEWQQSKRAGRDPKRTKEIFTDAWAMSDSTGGLSAALKERGFVLARGDRRGFVAMDHKGEAYAITRYCGVKAKEARARLGTGDDLPSASEAHKLAADAVRARLKTVFVQEKERSRERLRELAIEEARRKDARQVAERRLQEAQDARAKAEDQQRKGRIRRGFMGLVDVVIGRRKRIEAQNRIETERAELRNIRQREALARRHDAQKKDAEIKRMKELEAAKSKLQELRADIRDLKVKGEPKPERERAPPERKKRRAKTQALDQTEKTTSPMRQDFSAATAPDQPQSKREAFKAKRRAKLERPLRQSNGRSGLRLGR